MSEGEELEKYRGYKNWRDIGLGISVIVAVVGAVLAFSGLGNYLNIAAVKAAVDANGTNAGNPGTWITYLWVVVITVSAVPIAAMLFVWLVARNTMQQARKECETYRKIKDKLSTDANAHYAKVRSYARGAFQLYIAWAVIVGLAFVAAMVSLVWAIIGLTNTSKGANDHYFFILVVIGLAISGVGLLAMGSLMTYLGITAEVFCMKKGEDVEQELQAMRATMGAPIPAPFGGSRYGTAPLGSPQYAAPRYGVPAANARAPHHANRGGGAVVRQSFTPTGGNW